MSKKIYLHIGHGGSDSGAVGKISKEKDIALKVGTLINAKLLAKGLQTKMSRISDTKNSGAPKAANDWGADLVISLHCNSATSTARGVETLIFAKGGKAESFANIVNPFVVGVMDTLNRGVKVQNVEILRETNAPAVLIEMGFISNAEEEIKLNDSVKQNAIAQAVVLSICDYFKIKEEVKNVNDYEKHWAKQYIEKAINEGILSGYSDGSFRPDEPITRAQAAVIVCKLLEKLNK